MEKSSKAPAVSTGNRKIPRIGAYNPDMELIEHLRNMGGMPMHDEQISRRFDPLSSASPPLILLAGDESSNLELLAESLESRSFRTAVVRDGQEGLRYAGLLCPDLVLLDIVLPGMDGIEVCRRLKTDDETCDIPVIFMIAPDDGDKLLAGFEAGGVDYLPKPLQIEDVIKRLNLRLKLHGLQKPAEIQNADLNKHRELPNLHLDIRQFTLCDEVTERKRTEEHERERHYLDIFHNISDCIYLLEVTGDGRFRYLETNRAFEASAGVPKDSLRGKYIGELLRSSEDEATVEKAIAKFSRCLETGSVIDEEITLDFKSGRRICRSTLTPLFDNTGRIDRILCICRDITVRKRTEDALYFVAQRGWLDSSENFFDALAQYLGVTLDVDYVIIDKLDKTPDIAETVALYAKGANVPNLRYDLKGTPCENVMGRKFCFYPQGLQQLFPDDTLLVEMGAESYAGLPLWDAAGQPIGLIAIMDSKPLSDEGGISKLLQLLAIRAAAELERERSDRFLREREREFRTLAESLPDNIVRYNRDGVTVYVNPALEGILGDLAAEIIGTTPREFHSDGTFEDYAQLLDTVLASGEAGEIEKILPDSVGETRMHQIRMVPDRGEKGEVAGVLAIGRDITERKRMEAEAQNHLRFFESMDRVNRAIQGSSDLEVAMNGVLDEVLAIFDCDRAFLIHPCDPEADSWSVPLERTRPEYPGALALGLVLPMDADVATAFRILLDSDGPVTYGPGNQHSLPKDVSEQFSFKSMMSMAIYPKGDKPWHFGIHQCSRARVWTADEKKLFQEIGRRLADGLTSLLVFRDIQEREQKFRTLAENLPDHIARYDLQARKTYANPKLQQLLGRDAEVWLGKAPKELYPNGELDEYQAILEGVLRTGKCDDLEYKRADGIGGRRYYHIHFVPEHGPNGEILGALTIGRDVTRKRQLEQELIQSEREFRTLAENSPDVIVRYDRDCRRTYINRAYKVSTNAMEAEVLDKTPREYWRLAMPDADEYTGILQRVMKTRTQERIEVQLVDATGMLRYNSMHLVPELGDNDEVTSVLSISNDITDLKTAEQRREETSKQAERQLREFSSHLQVIREEEKACIAREIHDNLGGTLTALKMDLNWLLDELSTNQETTSVLKHVESISQLLDNAIVVTRSVITDLRPTILDDFGLLAAIEWQAEQFHKRTGIQCRVACYERHSYELDKTQTINLFRIFQESLTNVAKHSGASRVDVELQHENQRVIMTINDNGCGLPKEHIIFPTSYGMLGMRERTKQLGGRVNFYSPPGGGFSVTVILPRFTDNKNKEKA